jgi:DNA repair photolyase
LLEAGHKVRVQTRSAMVERDFDLLYEHRDRVLLGTSLPYLDDELARVLEPRASGPTRRLKMLAKATEVGLRTYVAIAPFMPWDRAGDLGSVVNAIRINGVWPEEIFCEVLNPKGGNLGMMREAIMSAGVLRFERHGRVLESYDARTWARFTYEILSTGHDWITGFIGWPDTGRGWKRHMEPKSAAFLEKMLPAKEEVAA